MSKDLPVRKQNRLSGYDYSEQGLYFVTICTQERENLFGEVVDQKMKLNDVGRMISETWLKLPIKFPCIESDEYVIMPDHFHGIIVLNGRENPAPTLGQPLLFINMKQQNNTMYP